MTNPGAPGQPPNDPYSEYPQYAPPGYPTYPQGTQQWPTPTPPKRRKLWPWVVGGAAIVLIAIGISSNPAPPAATSAPNGAGADIATPAAAAPAQTATGGARTSFGDGTWVVGEDIQPGTYKSAGAKAGIFELCSVTTLAGDTSDAPIIDWVTANVDEPLRIKVTGKVKAVKASGCEDFTKVG